MDKSVTQITGPSMIGSLIDLGVNQSKSDLEERNQHGRIESRPELKSSLAEHLPGGGLTTDKRAGNTRL